LIVFIVYMSYSDM